VKTREFIGLLERIVSVYGDLPIVGGHMGENTSPDGPLVVNTNGMEVFPNNPNNVDPKINIEGVFFE